jgi:hypothetical protein
MFEKVPAARMDNRKNSSTERLIATVPERRGKYTLQQVTSHFPSYLRRFDNLFGPLISESQWGAARLSAGCCGQFPTAQAHVAFL